MQSSELRETFGNMKGAGFSHGSKEGKKPGT